MGVSMKAHFGVLVGLSIALAGCATSPANHKTQAFNDVDASEARVPASQQLDEAARTPNRDEVSLQWGGNAYAELPNCKGSVALKREDGTLTLVVSNTSNCTNVFMEGGYGYESMVRVGKIENGAGTERIGLNEKIGSNKFRVLLTSNSGKTAGWVTIQSHVQPPRRSSAYDPKASPDFTLSTSFFGRRWAPLNDCGGSIYLTVEYGSVYLNFNNVAKCSNFDVLTANGDDANYSKQKINGPDGNRSEKIRIPNHLYDTGRNTVKVVVKSNSGKNYDIFLIKFVAL